MTSLEFVDTIHSVVLEAAVQDTLKLADRPPGRRPDIGLIELSTWFNKLPDTDRARVTQMLNAVAYHAVFGFLCVLDGVRAVEPLGPKGYFELRFVKDGKEHVLSGPKGGVLHELLK